MVGRYQAIALMAAAEGEQHKSGLAPVVASNSAELSQSNGFGVLPAQTGP